MEVGIGLGFASGPAIGGYLYSVSLPMHYYAHTYIHTMELLYKGHLRTNNFGGVLFLGVKIH